MPVPYCEALYAEHQCQPEPPSPLADGLSKLLLKIFSVICLTNKSALITRFDYVAELLNRLGRRSFFLRQLMFERQTLRPSTALIWDQPVPRKISSRGISEANRDLHAKVGKELIRIAHLLTPYHRLQLLDLSLTTLRTLTNGPSTPIHAELQALKEAVESELGPDYVPDPLEPYLPFKSMQDAPTSVQAERTTVDLLTIEVASLKADVRALMYPPFEPMQDATTSVQAERSTVDLLTIEVASLRAEVRTLSQDLRLLSTRMGTTRSVVAAIAPPLEVDPQLPTSLNLPFTHPVSWLNRVEDPPLPTLVPPAFGNSLSRSMFAPTSLPASQDTSQLNRSMFAGTYSPASHSSSQDLLSQSESTTFLMATSDPSFL